MKPVQLITFTILLIILSTYPGFGTERGLTSVVKQLDEQLLVGTV